MKRNGSKMLPKKKNKLLAWKKKTTNANHFTHAPVCQHIKNNFILKSTPHCCNKRCRMVQNVCKWLNEKPDKGAQHRPHVSTETHKYKKHFLTCTRANGKSTAAQIGEYVSRIQSKLTHYGLFVPRGTEMWIRFKVRYIQLDQIC